MPAWYRRFLEWYGKPSENDDFVDDWLQWSTWRIYVLGVAIGLIPALLLIRFAGL